MFVINESPQQHKKEINCLRSNCNNTHDLRTNFQKVNQGSVPLSFIIFFERPPYSHSEPAIFVTTISRFSPLTTYFSMFWLTSKFPGSRGWRSMLHNKVKASLMFMKSEYRWKMYPRST